jgi:hypothetical protein
LCKQNARRDKPTWASLPRQRSTLLRSPPRGRCSCGIRSCVDLASA